MRKYSIFDRDYKKKARSRRLKIFIGVLIIFFIGSGLYLVLVKKYKVGIKSIMMQKIGLLSRTNIIKNEKPEVTLSPSASSKPQTAEPGNQSGAGAEPKASPESMENFYDIQINGRNSFEAVYTNNNGNIEYSRLLGMGNSDNYDISPSKKSIVFLDGISQNLYLINIDGTLQDITKTNYIGTKDTVFKSSALENNPGYIWTNSPKFIDDNSIIYISQMPWFEISKKTKYLWVYDISSKTHTWVNDDGGQNIQINSASDKGIEVKVDDKTLYVNSKGEKSQ